MAKARIHFTACRHVKQIKVRTQQAAIELKGSAVHGRCEHCKRENRQERKWK